jgi:hypothetical protein
VFAFPFGLPKETKFTFGLYSGITILLDDGELKLNERKLSSE